MARLIIGLGSGRSASTSLARFLDSQPHSFFCHESAYDRPPFLRYSFGRRLPWERDEQEFSHWQSGLSRAAEGAEFFGDVASYLLPYVPLIRAAYPDACFICIKRERGAVVESLARKNSGINPWQSRPRSGMYPAFPEASSMREAIGAYWDLYYATAERYAREYPEAFRIFDLARLDERETQGAILDFAGFPREGRVYGMTKANGSLPLVFNYLANKLGILSGIAP